MSIVVLAIVSLAMITSGLMAATAGLLVRRDRQRLSLLTERLITEQRIDAATRATLQAMRNAARQRRG